MTRPLVRDLALYMPVVLTAYALSAASVHALAGGQPPMSFLTVVGVSALVGWWVPIVFAPAALLLLVLAARLPERWSHTARRLALLAVAPPLFAAAMGAAALAAAGNAAVLTWPYVIIVVIRAIVYAAAIHLPPQFDGRRST